MLAKEYVTSTIRGEQQKFATQHTSGGLMTDVPCLECDLPTEFPRSNLFFHPHIHWVCGLKSQNSVRSTDILNESVT